MSNDMFIGEFEAQAQSILTQARELHKRLEKILPEDVFQDEVDELVTQLENLRRKELDFTQEKSALIVIGVSVSSSLNTLQTAELVLLTVARSAKARSKQ